MNKKSMYMVFILVFSLIFNFGCQKTSETTEESSGAAPKSLVELMDEYHRVLRPLMHQALPDEDVATLKENASALLKGAEKIAAVEIPSKFEAKKDELSNIINGLLSKTKAFYETCQTGSDEEIMDTFRSAHDDYEALADIVYKL